jgi:hypothetical protein
VQWAWTAPQPSETEIAALHKEHGAQVTQDLLARDMRWERDARLEKADRIFQVALDAGDEVYLSQVKTYRRTLRDMPQQPGWPEKLVWPEPPKTP